MAREGVYMLCCYEAVPPDTVADIIRDANHTGGEGGHAHRALHAGEQQQFDGDPAEYRQ